MKNEFEFDELDKKTQKRVIDWFRTDDIGVVEHILEAVKQFKFDSEGKIIKKKENPRSFSILKCDKCNEEFAIDEGFIGAITCPYCSKMFIPSRIKKIKIAKREI